MSAFEEHTAVKETGAGVYEGRVHPGWWVVRGPHGGYLAAIILRALTLRLDDPSRPARSFTTHFASAPEEGPLEITTQIEREGRSMTTLSARTTQGDKLVALSLAAFSAAREGFDFDDSSVPAVGSPDEGFRVPTEGKDIPDFLGNFDMRWHIGGPPFSGSPEAQLGGWIRMEDPTIADAPAIACLLDAWPPAVFPRTTKLVVCPTIDFTVHFRSELPVSGANGDDFYLGRFTSKLSRDAFFEEDGELWSANGTLVAQSRQLALALNP
ncbi:MAG TPA: thioesterase family protein [Actinomycetota bacterium]|jgi:acyl-CoA thioesterase